MGPAGPKMHPCGPIIGPKWIQMGPKSLQGPQIGTDGPKMARVRISARGRGKDIRREPEQTAGPIYVNYVF
jgi:hypothetical protein